MNKLFYGDNLQILRKYIKDETIDLCYIDPPFNSKRNYNQIYNNIGREDQAQAQAFVDTWTWDTDAEIGFSEITNNLNGVFTKQSIDLIIGLERVLGRGALLSYLTHISLRVAEIYRVLKSTGSFYLHCDPTASHYLKLVLDSIFCAGRKGEYQNEIIWERTNAHNMRTKGYVRSNDTIFFYTKTNNFTFNEQYKDYGPEQMKRFKKDERGKLYKAENLTFSNPNPNRQFEWRGSKPPSNRSWGASLEQLEQWYKEGKILLKKDGSPRLDGLKIYLDETRGKPIGTNWTDIARIGNTSSERLGYPTQKPEALLDRIIKTSSSEGDLILDAYCGCGTTIAVSEKLKRRWIGIDITYQSISLMLKRLEESFSEDILKNIQLNGVPEDFESAEALANKEDDRTRKEFEKWAVLKFSNNRAMINEKKGGDGGIDGIAFMVDLNEKHTQEFKQILFSVKSNKILHPSVIRDLNGTIEREKAAIGVLITLYPMDNLVKESKKYGVYENKLLGHTYPKIEVVCISEILEGRTMNLPTSLEVLKKAEQKIKSKQKELDF